MGSHFTVFRHHWLRILHCWIRRYARARRALPAVVHPSLVAVEMIIWFGVEVLLLISAAVWMRYCPDMPVREYGASERELLAAKSQYEFQDTFGMETPPAQESAQHGPSYRILTVNDEGVALD